jgi:hypothetical protein
VFFFSKATLDRVLAVTAENPTPKEFLKFWPRRDKSTSTLSEEYLADGDIIVQLDICGALKWRSGKH